MQKMLGAQQAPFRETGEGHRALRLHIAVAQAGVRARADGKRVEHGSDAGRCNLRVVDHESGIRIPQHAGARRQMLLEIVRMQFDQTRQQVIAVPVFGFACGGRAALDVVDLAVFDAHHAGKYFVSRHDASVPDQHRNCSVVGFTSV